jgi:hypothetical protein
MCYPAQSVWDLRRTEWSWYRFLSNHFCCRSVSIIPPIYHIHSSTTDAVYLNLAIKSIVK